MLSKFFDRVLAENENEVEKGSKPPEKHKRKITKLEIVEIAVVFLILLVPRLLYVFKFGNPNFPGWYTDAFHHWQVAYLSKEIGFKQGFLRLWDFKGMEFFWGLLHPLVLSWIFAITGSIHILTTRLLSVFGGVVAYALLFVTIKRYFNRASAWVSILFASFFPITLFSNTVGMQEELALPFIFGAVLAWPQSPALAGIFLALASMVRAEYWLFAFGLVLATLVLRRDLNKAGILVFVYFFLMLLYMKYLAAYTGSYIYPIKWNFLASVKGEWFENLPIVGEKLLAKRINQGIFAVGVIGSLLTLVKRPKCALLYLFGFGNILFIGFMIGFGSYVKGYIPRFWVDRFYNWPYLFSAIFVILLFFYYLPRLHKNLKIPSVVFGWLVVLAGLAVSQLLWRPINYFMEPVESVYNSEKIWADEIAAVYDGGKILLPEDRPYITYFLAHDYGIQGKNMVGQMFDPFYYFPDQNNLFDNWGEDREVVLNWLKDENIKLIALTSPKKSYLGLIEREPEFFEEISGEQVKLFRVNIK